MDWATERTGRCVPRYVISSEVKSWSADRVNRELRTRDLNK